MGTSAPVKGGGGWHKALVVGSVSLWRPLLASGPGTLCYDKQASALLRASTFLGGESRMQLLPMASSPDGLISARYAVILGEGGGSSPPFALWDADVGCEPLRCKAKTLQSNKFRTKSSSVTLP